MARFLFEKRASKPKGVDVNPMLIEHSQIIAYASGSWNPLAKYRIAADGGWHSPEPAS